MTGVFMDILIKAIHTLGGQVSIAKLAGKNGEVQ